MSAQEDSTLGVRPVKDVLTGHRWLWLAAIIGAVVICFAAVAGLGSLVSGGQ